jgi:hypothetical protein
MGAAKTFGIIALAMTIMMVVIITTTTTLE